MPSTADARYLSVQPLFVSMISPFAVLCKVGPGTKGVLQIADARIELMFARRVDCTKDTVPCKLLAPAVGQDVKDV
jgi:hypothetical protein